jgi:hypothetical protein
MFFQFYTEHFFVNFDPFSSCNAFFLILGSHGRVWRKQPDGTYQRCALIQTLEPLNWMWEVERFGYATRKTAPQTAKDMLVHVL